MKKGFISIGIVIVIIIILFFVKISVSTPRACLLPPCPQETKIPLGIYLLHKVFPNNFRY